jgi:hypothetical protein
VFKNIEQTKIKAGHEFEELQGQYLIVEGGWNGHKTALSSKAKENGLVPSKADLDLWIQKVEDGLYYYIASYEDDIIVVRKRPMVLIDTLKETYALKGIGIPEYYLGGNFDEVDDPELVKKGIKTALSATTYIKNSIEKFERMFGGMIKESKFPMIEGPHPESDT